MNIKTTIPRSFKNYKGFKGLTPVESLALFMVEFEA